MKAKSLNIYSRGYNNVNIHVFVVSGQAACIESLISWGADVDYDIPHLGTPLYIACISQQLQCTQKLLDGGEFDVALCKLLLFKLSKKNKEIQLHGIFFNNFYIICILMCGQVISPQSFSFYLPYFKLIYFS